MTKPVEQRPPLVPHNCPQIWQQALLAHQQNRLITAIDYYRQVITQNPEFADAHANLAMALCSISQNQAADRAFRRALELQPNHANNHNNYSFFLLMEGQYLAAEQHARRAVQLAPQLSGAWVNLGHALRLLNRWAEAVSCYQVSWPLDCTRPEILGDWVNCLSRLCRWAAQERLLWALRQASARRLECGGISPIEPFLACRLPLSLAEFQQICASYAHSFSHSIPGQGLKCHFPHLPRNQHRGDAQIKIGYVCGAFSDHPVGQLTAGLFERHDRTRFKIYGYATTADDGSTYRDRIKSSIENFREVHNLSHMEIATAIYQDGIDILVDLDGYTTNHRQQVFALKPAPIQITWLGFPGTTGASYMDYLIADAVIVPPAAEPFYTETIIRLPHTYQVNDHRQLPPSLPLDRVTARQAQGLPATGLIFCSFNNNYKIDRHTCQAWLEILKAVPHSTLWVSVTTSEALENLQRAAQNVGIDPVRLVPVQWAHTHREHMQRLELADLYLDCFIYNAHTTATDALWAGVPVLTCMGETFAARVGASLLTAAELPELICTSPQQFVERAIHLARNPQELKDLRDRLQQQKDHLPLFDTDTWVRNLESALFQIYHGDRSQSSPAESAIRAKQLSTNSYSIYIVSPPDYPHSHAFDEFAETLHYACQALGYLAPIVRTPTKIVGTPIVLGANLLPRLPHLELPVDSIIFNLEQVYQGSPWFEMGYIDLLKRYQVWDYSERNIVALAEVFGVTGVWYCPIGYVP